MSVVPPVNPGTLNGKNMRILNLYAGIGGNRKLWKGSITAVEICPKRASLYSRLFPQDTVLVEDAHNYLLHHFREFDFIWSSPPCQTHSCLILTRPERRRYPDLKLYEEILFCRQFVYVPWVIENVKPFYPPLIPPSCRVERHLFWSNFRFYVEGPKRDFMISEDNIHTQMAYHNLGVNRQQLAAIQKRHPEQVIRNCVHPHIGEQILAAARRVKSKTRKYDSLSFNL